MILRVTLNTQDKGDIFVARTPALDFLLKAQDLKSMGFKDPAGTPVLLEGEPHLSLQSMPGVRFSFDEKALVLHITAAPELLPSRTLASASQQQRRGPVAQGNSAFFNYALTASAGSSAPGTRWSFASELGWRLGEYLLLSDASTITDASGHSRLVRLMSSVTHDDRDKLQRIVVGDFFTPSRDFSNGINLGGISISKLYGLNPYLVQFPMHSVSGNAALPSDLEIYLDGQRIRSEKIQPGQFELHDLLAYGGARNVQMVLRDAFGRVQQFSYSFYFSDQALRQGLHEYSYSLGALRRGYGAQSNRYGPAAFALFHRYGASDALTLGLRAEGTRGFYNAGPLATVVLGSLGVVNLALAASAMDHHQGASGSLVYNYQAARWSLGLSLRRDWGEYAAMGDPPTFSNRRDEGSIVAGYALPGLGTASLSHSFLSTRAGLMPASATGAQPFSVSLLQNRRVTALSYSVPLVSGRVSLQASLSHIKDASSRNEAFLGLIFFLDKDYAAAANYRRTANDQTESLQFTKNQPIGEGLGYVVSADHASSAASPTSAATAQSTHLDARVEYNAPAAVLRGELSRRQDGGHSTSDYRAAVAGGLAYVDGEASLGRPVTGSFGIVKVGQLPGVKVFVNSQPIGQTDASGKVFIPTLAPYFDNDVSIAPESVPIEYTLAATLKKVSPSWRGGAVIDFGVTRIQAFSAKLHWQQDGVSKPVEFQQISFTAEGKPQSLQTGRGGEFYIENLQPGRYGASVQIEGKPCAFDLDIPSSQEAFVDLGEVMCRWRP
ncbi:MAG: fimbria/pilus outer membrane usher protein [Pseudomonadota bacterium]|nr:fimbria/pilus outer membrane usher protein [Pseudomonadota bacterium]